jgi:hypothetical protein
MLQSVETSLTAPATHSIEMRPPKTTGCIPAECKGIRVLVFYRSIIPTGLWRRGALRLYTVETSPNRVGEQQHTVKTSPRRAGEQQHTGETSPHRAGEQQHIGESVPNICGRPVVYCSRLFARVRETFCLLQQFIYMRAGNFLHIAIVYLHTCGKLFAYSNSLFSHMQKTFCI